MHLLSQIIYSCKMLYMFWTVFPSIIRRSKLHIQQLTYTVAVYAVLSSWWWVKRPPKTCGAFYNN